MSSCLRSILSFGVIDTSLRRKSYVDFFLSKEEHKQNVILSRLTVRALYSRSCITPYRARQATPETISLCRIPTGNVVSSRSGGVIHRNTRAFSVLTVQALGPRKCDSVTDLLTAVKRRSTSHFQPDPKTRWVHADKKEGGRGGGAGNISLLILLKKAQTLEMYIEMKIFRTKRGKPGRSNRHTRCDSDHTWITSGNHHYITLQPHGPAPRPGLY